MIWCIYHSTELVYYLFGFPVPHETVYVQGCLENTKVEAEAELQVDGEEVVYADFQSGQEVWTLPEFLGPFPSSTVRNFYKNAVKGRRLCQDALALWILEEKCPPEVKGKEQINFMTIIKTKMKSDIYLLQ